MSISYIKCLIKAIPFFLTTGEFVPHVYQQEPITKVIIISTDKSFRVSDNYTHKPNETVHADAGLITYTCKHCGHKTTAWFKPYTDKYKYE